MVYFEFEFPFPVWRVHTLKNSIFDIVFAPYRHVMTGIKLDITVLVISKKNSILEKTLQYSPDGLKIIFVDCITILHQDQVYTAVYYFKFNIYVKT